MTNILYMTYGTYLKLPFFKNLPKVIFVLTLVSNVLRLAAASGLTIVYHTEYVKLGPNYRVCKCYKAVQG